MTATLVTLPEILARHQKWRLHEDGGTKAVLIKAALSGADLSGANLGEAFLRESVLSSANLSGADLSGADLNGAVLSEANLRGADMRGADMRGADLLGADLSGANLSGAGVAVADIHPYRLVVSPTDAWIGCQRRPIGWWRDLAAKTDGARDRVLRKMVPGYPDHARAAWNRLWPVLSAMIDAVEGDHD